MKKFLLICFTLMVLGGCSKDKSTEQSFFVNTYYTYSDHPDYGEKIADNTFVALYKDNGVDIDIKKTDTFNPAIYDTDGNKLELKYTSDTTVGINTFKDISNGQYVILVIYTPSTFVRYYTFKKISVNSAYNGTTEKMVFDCSANNGYQTWSE